MITRVYRGLSPNCSSAGSLVGAALISAVAGAAVLNAYADRLGRWWRSDGGEGPPGPPVRDEGDRVLVLWPEPPAVVELEGEAAAGARRRGTPHGPTGSDVRPVPGARVAPVEVHLTLTTRCPVPCQGCYLGAGPGERAAPSAEAIDTLLDQLGAMGVFQVAMGGGEVGLRDDLLDRLRAARRAGLVPNLTLTGFGLNPARAAAMADLVGQVNVSLDGVDTRAVRGWDAAPVARTALRILREAGIKTGVNTVLTRANLDQLPALAEVLVAEGVQEWQWLRFKPAGRGAEVYRDLALTPEQIDQLWPMALAFEAAGLRIRWDCAMAPFLAAAGVPVEAAQRLGVVGCVGGASLLAFDGQGRAAPCSFVPAGEARDPHEAWRQDPTVLAWRQRAAAPPAPCASCDWREVCRGGCRAVAAHLTGDSLAPDPECPRVRGAA